MVFQDPTGSLNPRQTIYEIIAEGLRIHGIDRGPNGETEEDARRAGAVARGPSPARALLPALPARALGRPASTRRDRRRARAGPGGASSPTSRCRTSTHRSAARSSQLLMQLRADLGLSIIIVTHDLGLAWTVADRIAVMYLGRLVELGPTEDVLLRPLHPYTRALLDVVPEAGGIDRPVLEGEAPDPTKIPSGCRFHPRCPVVASGRAEELGILEKCTGEDLMIEEIAPITEPRAGRRRWANCLGPPPPPIATSGIRATAACSSASSPPLRTPRIASISESPTGASRCASRPRTDASNVRRLASAISARASSSRSLDAMTSARCSAPTRASREARASSRAVRRLARGSATSRPSSTSRSTAALPTSEYIGADDDDPVLVPDAAAFGSRGFRGRRPSPSRSPASIGRASSRR